MSHVDFYLSAEVLLKFIYKNPWCPSPKVTLPQIPHSPDTHPPLQVQGPAEKSRLLNRVQFHGAAKQRKLLTRNICLADFLGYQPNLHVKLMYFGW